MHKVSKVHLHTLCMCLFVEDESTADDGEDKRAVITVDSDSDDVMPAKRSKRAGRRQK